MLRSPFDYLDSNRDSEVTIEELKENAPFYGHFDEFSAKYWPIFDTDNLGTLNFEESMFFIAAINDGFAGLVIKVRKLRSHVTTWCVFVGDIHKGGQNYENTIISFFEKFCVTFFYLFFFDMKMVKRKRGF